MLPFAAMKAETISRSEKLKRACKRYRPGYVAAQLGIDQRYLPFIRKNIDELIAKIDRMPVERE